MREPATVEPPRRRWVPGDRRGLSVLALVLAGGLGGIALIGMGTVPGPGPSPTAAGSPAGSTAPATPIGFRRFEAPGITFTYPATWQPQPMPTEWLDTWSHRYLGLIVDGTPPCERMESPEGTVASPRPCTADFESAGSLSLIVSHYLHPVPGETLFGRPPSFGADPTFEQGSGQWYVADPDGGLYGLSFVMPFGGADGRAATIHAIVDSVVTTHWTEPARPSADGWTMIESHGIPVAYPDGWSAYSYMPWYVGMAGTGSPTLLLASAPLDPCAAIESCHVQNPPPAGVVLQFHMSMPAFGPDWTDANEVVDGHAAFRSAPQVFKDVEYFDLRIRLYEEGIAALEIRVGLRGFDDAALRQQVEDLIDRIQLPDAPAA